LRGSDCLKLVQKSGMPYFVKGLRDIRKCSGAVCLVFEGFVNPVNDAMRLFDGGVSPPEA
jgi:hypothetical protein